MIKAQANITDLFNERILENLCKKQENLKVFEDQVVCIDLCVYFVYNVGLTCPCMSCTCRLYRKGSHHKYTIQANLGYYVASELRFFTPGLHRGKIRQSGCLHRCGCPPPHWKTFVYFGASSHD
jgi:hypothetical protein